MKILFVCTGNTCRSPMAQAVMTSLLDKRGRQDIIVSSAGISSEGGSASAGAVAALTLRDPGMAALLRGFRSSSVTREMLEASDIIAVMTPQHAAAVIALGADPRRIRILGGGIADPYGGDTDMYVRTLEQLEKSIEALVNEIEKGIISSYG